MTTNSGIGSKVPHFVNIDTMCGRVAIPTDTSLCLSNSELTACNGVPRCLNTFSL
jgi:hypothetical protein